MKKKHIRNFLILTTLTAIGMHSINKAISITSPMKNLLKKENGNFYNWRYGNIYYTKNGKGSPLLLIHDLNPASSDYEWHKIIKHLAKKAHCIYFGLTGLRPKRQAQYHI